jgi:YHS domain-containing protein
MKSTDPVCGMKVDTESAAARSSISGTEYVFCSTACHRTFEAHPEQFVAGGKSKGGRAPLADAKPEADPPFTKTGDIVAPMFGSAGSGGLEYEQIPEPPNQESR